MRMLHSGSKAQDKGIPFFMRTFSPNPVAGKGIPETQVCQIVAYKAGPWGPSVRGIPSELSILESCSSACFPVAAPYYFAAGMKGQSFGATTIVHVYDV